MAQRMLTSSTPGQPEAEINPAVRCGVDLCGEGRVGLGCMALTGIYGEVSRADAVETLHAALAAGITLFDTAALYGSGANEELLGEVLGHRSHITIVTKFGLSEGADGSLVRDSRPSTIRASVEASLRRLRRERLDLVLQHRPDPAVPDHVVAEAVSALMEEGKVGAFGLSGTGTDRLRSWPSQPSIRAVQNELSLSAPDRAGEPALVMAHGAVFMAYAPLGRGLLTSSRPAGHGDLRLGMPGFQNPDAGTSTGPVAAVHKLADRHGTSTSRIAVAWLLARCANVVAIPGCRSCAQVQEIMNGGRMLLSRDEMVELNGAI